MILIIDNYDSFTYNLYQYLGDLGAEPIVRRNDAITLEGIMELSPERIVLSPGPGHPANRRDFGVCADILEAASGRIRAAEHGTQDREPGTRNSEPETQSHGAAAPSPPALRAEGRPPDALADVPILGVCLGHQGIIHHFGGTVGKAGEPMHGKTSMVEHDGKGLFEGLASPMQVMRYHSLVGKDIPQGLEVCARSVDDGEVMAVRAKGERIYGVQFHPESIMTGEGKRILENFLRC